ncbi:Cytoplasmic dynein 1 heavy chain [Echinococcus granulosus]|uniref:Cytoplasmic dynein 1 heavy chain n=1 Tax=Echinococcus granulosus TaxID=6210 RepID=W6URA8_ECHGR|nr:Cytoplasmic dynein 1 heavy chain [Echinococcus granulosus]EUB63753.1 Cytoplasmic dynein 1 heavy chain [Echinococcus granulosus]
MVDPSSDVQERSSEVQVVVADKTLFENYIKNIVAAFDGAENATALDKAISDRSAQDAIGRFLSDGQCHALLVRKSSNKGTIFLINPEYLDDDDESDGADPTFSYTISTDVHYTNPKIQRDGDKVAPSVEKKIAELEIGLLHLQQNIDIPEIALNINPTVLQVIKKCEEERRRAKVSDFEAYLQDSSFLNSLQSGVNRWIKDIQKVTNLNRDPSTGTALQEVTFWLNLERALSRIQEKRSSLEVTLTLEILRTAKRFLATVSFDSDTGLTRAIDMVNDYNPLMKDFPLNDLLSATELDKIKLALQAIFTHLRKIRNTKYPIQRCLKLIEAISRDLTSQLLKVLGTRRLMHMPYDEFDHIMTACFDVFGVWDDEYEKIQSLLREICKKKREEPIRMVWRTNLAHRLLQARLDNLRKLWHQHEQLRLVIVRVRPTTRTSTTQPETAKAKMVEDEPKQHHEEPLLDAADANAIDDVNKAFELVKEVDCLDLSKEGMEVWDATIKRYEERIDGVETRIAARLRDLLGTAKSANEMFRYFSRFNALFVRPHIRGAIREYQTQLINRVREDIEALHEKFKNQYRFSRASRLSKLRDIPPVAGSIIWARQIEERLNTYLRRVEDVLGKLSDYCFSRKGWEHHREGQDLKSNGKDFKAKLNTNGIFDEWCRKVQQNQFNATRRIFCVEPVRVKIPNKDGSTQTTTMMKLAVTFVLDVITLSKEVRCMKAMGFRVPLSIVNRAHQTNILYPSATSLNQSVQIYEAICAKIDANNAQNLALLCAGLRREAQSLISEGVQLNWDSYRLSNFVQKFAEAILQFQEKVEDLLQVTREIDLQLKALVTCPYSKESFEEIIGKIQKLVDDLNLHKYSNLAEWVAKLDVEVENRLITRLEAGIREWTRVLHTDEKQSGEAKDADSSMSTSMVVSQQRLGGEPKIKQIFLELRITNQQMHLHPSIEVASHELFSQLTAWQNIILNLPRIQHSRYQVGFNTEEESQKFNMNLISRLSKESDVLIHAHDAIFGILSETEEYVKTWTSYQALWDLQVDQVWMNVLDEIKVMRRHFDVAETQKAFGPIVIVFDKVQSKVTLKYDSWHKEILSKFGSNLGSEMQDFYKQVSEARTELEKRSVDSKSTSDAVNTITYTQSLKRKLKQWEKQVNLYKTGQNILYRDRFQFPNNWRDSENIQGEWSAFQEILRRKESSISSEVASLQMKIVTEDKAVEGKTAELLNSWHKEKPIQGNMKPDEAVKALTILEGQFLRLKEERANIQRAKEALELTEEGVLPPSEERVNVALEELQVMQDLKNVWIELSRFWEEIDQLRETPWQSVQPRKIRQQIDEMVRRLKEVPARLRHYAAYEHIRHTVQNFAKVNPIVIDLKSEALKERHWRTLIRKLNVNWVMSELTLGQLWDIDLQKNEAVIRDVFLVAQGEKALEEFMKQVTEVWKTYELDLVIYQNRCRLIRGWDDLFSRVKEHINSVEAMKLSPYFKQFEEEALTWEDRLNRINALFDVWIDVQRRWVYLDGIFSGSADIKTLLAQESQRFSSHFKKMFAGVNAIKLNEECTEVLGLISKEGEEVDLVHPISIKDNPTINDWLSLLEKEMRITLASYLGYAVAELQKLRSASELESTGFLAWLDRYQAQLVVLAAQICWSESVDAALNNPKSSDSLTACLRSVEAMLTLLADTVLSEQPPIRRRKLEHLIMEHVHQRDILRVLIQAGVNSSQSFEWLSQMRFYFDPKQSDPLAQISIHMANAKFAYGFEYLGVMDRLVQTPLTDRCYLTMTQALEARLGGSPFGPAGTGKTESVKALGMQLGRFVLVFNCDETFDFHAMGRIFVGLCQVGAWGCFDEFNRLEERMLSAVSQQIQGIQEALRDQSTGKDVTVELLGKNVSVNPDMAIFITMNPGYAGRSNLPDNLKKLFRSLAMTQPDRQLIAQVMLYSQGFRTAELLSNKVVPLFKLCDEQLSPQSHYDFGLRALKSVLVSAGNVKRDRIKRIKDELHSKNEAVNESNIAEHLPEQEILIQSIMETMVPKLVAQDIPLLYSLLKDVFPGVSYSASPMEDLRRELKRVCEEMYLVYSDDTSDSGTGGALWVQKVLQLYQITCIHHGLMMVGPSGSGKSMAWRALLKALERVEGIEGVAHVIDPKSISKDSLYGYLDPNTREWTDGLFTHTLRKIIDSIRGESQKRQWIIFDGDVDPEWVENLNSVLDDNKLLTLPNGERLGIPPNVRIMFEVQDLRYATLATVSRCGMVWFSEDIVTPEMVMTNFLRYLQNVPVDEDEDADLSFAVSASLTAPSAGGDQVVSSPVEGAPVSVSPTIQTQRDIANMLVPHFGSNGLVSRCLEFAKDLDHIMDFTQLRALTSLFSLLKQAVRAVLVHNASHTDFPMPVDQMESFVSKSLVNGIIWSMAGDGSANVRMQMSDFVRQVTTIPLPPPGMPIIDYEVAVTGEWQPWINKVPIIEVESHKINTMDVVVPTLDTVRHEALLYTWLAEHRPMVLCGPPGSGKTMTLFSALRSLPDMEVIGLNFSSATTPELMLKTFDQYCEYRKTPHGLVLAPQQINKWLVFFCDEINLPNEDKYGTQRVISFLRQMLEHSGFYQTSDMQWVRFERIQFVGACNPPTDPGRKPLSHRFLRHVPVVYVDYPGEMSLKQIYGTFNRAMLRMLPTLRSQADALTNAMVDFYLRSQKRFTIDMQPHYIYSPRELTRWVRGIHEALKPLESLSVEGLVRIWAHEALRLFQDRLIHDNERLWTDQNVDEVAMTYFPFIDRVAALQRPILFSNWLSKDYVAVDQEALREYVKARLKVFYEEELDVPLVLFNQVLDHVLRIDRVFRQAQGHLLLIGISGAGKTTLSRFVSWMNGLSVFQVKVHNKYTAEDFDEDLRNVLRRSGCKGEKITFIMDESNVMDSSFLERMNTLLANGEVPGLFEGDEFAALMTQCKEGAAREGLVVDSQEELYKWFTNQICRNLHVVFTMNPSSDGLKDKAATSPALFNRCVLNWFGDWSLEAYFQVGKEFTEKLDLECSDYQRPEVMPYVAQGLLPDMPTYRDMVVNAFVFVHQSLQRANERLQKRGGRTMAITPRHFLDFISHYVKLIGEKRSDLEEQQLHLNVGLQKIRETVQQVEVMQKSLTKKSKELEEMNEAANAKLKQMVKDQQEAEQKKTTSQSLQVELGKQREYIKEKRALVVEELSQVEPAVNDAKQAVEGIRKKDIQEIKAMRNPPPAVKMALEAICLLLGEKSTEWRQILTVIVKDSFVPSILNFDTEEITDSIRETMKKKYIENPEFNYEKVNRASTACGPMVKWAIAQIGYADILKKVEPLRDELKALEDAASANEKKAEDVEATIETLEKSIARYKDEYAVLISQAQSIKADLASVEAKVERSVALIKSLSSERTRWEAGSETFKSQMATIIGDCLLSSAFMAYAGYFDQSLRLSLVSSWAIHLKAAGIQFRPDLARVEYLSTPDERLRWQASVLPDDELSVENAIILHRFNRYPLIIDPSGQAIEFLMEEYKAKKIAKTSFLDDAFRKTLESSLRFGTPLLVQDVESYDPILNPVLNREVRRTGGRTLITLGDQDIDLSPTFIIFLSTRDPSVDFAPDVCSRVTFVNFTVTHSSLQSQCLNAVLKAERPDVDNKRSDLLKMQGEFQLRLRHLEKDLLQALNAAEGNLLDDDKIITNLETLKKEAGEVAKKVEETDAIMAEVDNVSQQYVPLSQACSGIYFTLDALNQVHFLYQYSLQFLLSIFNVVLTQNENLKGVNDSKTRLDIITKDLFQVTYNRVGRGMLHSDQITFAVLLARIYLKGKASAGVTFESEFSVFLHGQDSASLLTSKNLPDIKGLTVEQRAALSRLQSQLPAFRNIVPSIRNELRFNAWLETVSPETEVPTLWELSAAQATPVGTAIHSLLLIQALRPDRLLACAHMLVFAVFGQSFMDATRANLDLGSLVEQEIKANVPVLLCATPGFDPSGRVEDLAADSKKTLTGIAIGSTEGFSQAEKAINAAVKQGKWVMLKNVHLAPSWLVQLEKKLHSFQPHPNFRLFLTMEINPRLPVNLLRSGRVLVFEPPPGIKASLLRTFANISTTRMSRAPAERSRLYFLLAWFNAVVQERLRYAPLGWTKRYEFNESDLKSACDTIDTWVDSASKGRSNLPPNQIPWSAIRQLMSQCIYGGRIDNDFDQTLLDTFLSRLFTEHSFDHDFVLVKDVDGQAGKSILIPEGTSREELVAWIKKLPAVQTPSWLGLPNNAEKVLLTNMGQEVIGNLLKMQQAVSADDLLSASEVAATTLVKRVSVDEGDTRPMWIRQLQSSADTWKSLLPDRLRPLERTAENIADPLFRCFDREVNAGATLLNTVRDDLRNVIKVCSGTIKPTNYHRDLMSDLAKGLIPASWRRYYTIPSTLTVIQWINDFAARIRQLIEISEAASSTDYGSLRGLQVWLGGLFMPEAYITATRQAVAQTHGWALEELFLSMELVIGAQKERPPPLPADGCSFVVSGLRLMGAEPADAKTICLSHSIFYEMPFTILKWIRVVRDEQGVIDANTVKLPVYLNAARSVLLFTVGLHTREPGSEFYKRGVALLSSPLG